MRPRTGVFGSTYEATSVDRPGDFLQAWLISGVAPVRPSRLRLEAPAGYQPIISLSPAAPAAEVSEGQQAKTWEWTAEDVDPIRREPFMPQESALVHWVQISADDDWASIGRWYAETYPLNYEVTDIVAAVASDAVGDAEGVDALQALHAWISRDLRYVSVTLGEGGYQARSPQEVVLSQAGDCKDKAGLFIALARQLGFEAYPTILKNGAIDERAPSLGQLDHLIAAVRLDGEWVYVDLTNGWVPLGEVPFQYQGELGIIAMDDGSTEVITFPEEDVSALQSLTQREHLA